MCGRMVEWKACVCCLVLSGCLFVMAANVCAKYLSACVSAWLSVYPSAHLHRAPPPDSWFVSSIWLCMPVRRYICSFLCPLLSLPARCPVRYPVCCPACCPVYLCLTSPSRVSHAFPSLPPPFPLPYPSSFLQPYFSMCVKLVPSIERCADDDKHARGKTDQHPRPRASQTPTIEPNHTALLSACVFSGQSTPHDLYPPKRMDGSASLRVASTHHPLQP